MGKLFINMLQIGEKSEEAKKLVNFKDPKNNFRGQNSDFASVLHTVIANRFVGSNKYSVLIGKLIGLILLGVTQARRSNWLR